MVNTRKKKRKAAEDSKLRALSQLPPEDVISRRWATGLPKDENYFYDEETKILTKRSNDRPVPARRCVGCSHPQHRYHRRGRSPGIRVQRSTRLGDRHPLLLGLRLGVRTSRPRSAADDDGAGGERTAARGGRWGLGCPPQAVLGFSEQREQFERESALWWKVKSADELTALRQSQKKS